MPNSYFYVAEFCLSLLGFWPCAPITKFNTFQAVSNVVILFICVFSELLQGYVYLQYDFELALETFCPASTSAVTLLKMLLILRYRNELRLLLERMKAMLYDTDNISSSVVNETQNGNDEDAKQQIRRAHTLLATRITFMPAVTSLTTATAYALKPILMVGIMRLQHKAANWKLPYNLYMPSLLLQAPYFVLTYAFTSYTGFLTITMFSGCDALFFEYCINVAALFRMLEHDVEQAFAKYELRLKLSPLELDGLELRLTQLIKRHNRVIFLLTDFVRCYALITLAHFVSAAIVISLSTIDLMMYTGFSAIIYVMYTVAALTQLFIYCYGGTLVSESSVHLSVTLFGSRWDLCTPQLRRMLHLMLVRAQSEVSVRVPFFAPSLVTFASILQASGSIIAMASSLRRNDS